MFPIAGQTDGPNGLKFFVDTKGWPGGVLDKKLDFFYKIIFFSGQRRAPQLVFNI